MILLFPNLDTFRLAVTSGTVPPDVTLTPAAVSRDADGRIFVETTAKLAKKAETELKRLKVLGSKRHGGPAEPVASWLQVLPLTADAGPPQLSSQAPVLFELSSPDLLPGLVAEMLRLGNDRQSYRSVTDGDTGRVLLRVIGPPYYTLLRAVDNLTFDGGTVRAYTEQAPRVWVELGFTHPLAKQVKLDDGQMVLVRPPHEWAYLPDGPFQDVYDVLTFTLPAAATDWAEAPAPGRIVVPLKLAAGNAADPAEMWVLRGDGVARLDALVRDSGDRLAEQLRFAVGTAADGETVVALGVAPSKKEPPVLALDNAVAFRSYWRIPNLFLPVGTRLHPTIRRDVVTKLLAEDRDRRVWLFPGPDGTFTPEAIPENAFRPLAEWVEYVVGTNAAELREWVAAAEFDFESFVCTDAGPKPRTDRDKPDREKRDKDDREPPAAAKAATKTAAKKTTATAYAPAEPTAVVAKPPSEWKVRCDELEREFRDLDGPLDSPDRQALWPQLAEANAHLGGERKGEAAICWVNALWAAPTPDLVSAWADSETPDAPRTAPELDARLAVKTPLASQARAAVSLFLAVADKNPDWLRSRLPLVQAFLEEHEAKLPVRAAWLAAVRLASLTGSDVLGLARVRDRLIARLLERGLSPEQDLPTFLRFAGLKNSERLRVVRERMADLHKVARAWVEASLKAGGSQPRQTDTTCTPAYADLMFAFGLAKLGESSPAQALADNARRVLTATNPQETRGITAHFLAKVFQYRVDQALAGEATTTRLPPLLLDELDQFDKKGSRTLDDPHRLALYAISRMREQSEIIEPQERNNPYAEWTARGGHELHKELAELPKIRDPKVLARRITDLLKNGPAGQAASDTRFDVLLDSLLLAPRVGQDFTLTLVRQVPAAIAELAPGKKPFADLALRQGKLLERALFLAAYYDEIELMQALVGQFLAFLKARKEEDQFELVNVVAGRCLRSLRKLGLREQMDQFLRRLQDEVLKGRTLAQVKAAYAGKPNVWADALQTMLNLAAGWLMFDLREQAVPILDAARQEIFTAGPKFLVQKLTNLCRAYVSAAGQEPADAGLARMVELYQKLDPALITNTYTAAQSYSRFHLNLVESTVLAVVADDYALGQSGQRWLAEDEQIVRKRIHADMRSLLARV